MSAKKKKKKKYCVCWWSSPTGCLDIFRNGNDPRNPSHQSHNASDKYPTMHHFVTEMCTCVYISVIKWWIVGHGTGALWDFCYKSIGPHIYIYMNEENTSSDIWRTKTFQYIRRLWSKWYIFVKPLNDFKNKLILLDILIMAHFVWYRVRLCSIWILWVIFMLHN